MTKINNERNAATSGQKAEKEGRSVKAKGVTNTRPRQPTEEEMREYFPERSPRFSHASYKRK